MVLAWLVTALLVLTTISIHYECFRLMSDRLIPRLADIHRLRVAVVVIGCFCAHIAEIFVFAGFLYVSALYLGFGALEGAVEGKFTDYLYFSIVNYTSLGLGDIHPTGELRLLTGVEALLGLMMITWSASFTFLEMQRLWEDREDVGPNSN